MQEERDAWDVSLPERRHAYNLICKRECAPSSSLDDAPPTGSRIALVEPETHQVCPM